MYSPELPSDATSPNVGSWGRVGLDDERLWHEGDAALGKVTDAAQHPNDIPMTVTPQDARGDSCARAARARDCQRAAMSEISDSLGAVAQNRERQMDRVTHVTCAPLVRVADVD